MPKPIIARGNKGGYVSARVVGPNTSGGFLLNSSIAGYGANAIGETVSSASIIEVAWVLGANSATIKRGANTVLRLTGEGWMSLTEAGIQLETSGEKKANCQIIMPGAGTVVLKLHKNSDFVSDY